MVFTRHIGSHWLQTVAVRGCLIAGVVLLTAGIGPCESQEASQERTGAEPQAQRILVDSGTPDAESTSAARSNNSKPKEASSPAQPVHQERQAEPSCESCQTAADQRKDAREQADLDAQEIMAIATKDMAEVSEWQFWVSFGGLVLLFYTLRLTRQSNRAAIRAAEAADRSVAIAQQNARDELRAYVSFVPRGLKHSGTNLYFIVDLVNSGSTPAMNVHVSCAGEKIVYPIPSAGNLPELTQLRGTRTLAPGVESRIHFRHNDDISDRHLHEFRESRSSRFTFAGRVEYTDIYGAKRWTETCWSHRYNEGDWKAMKLDVRETGLEYAAYGNESDNIHQDEADPTVPSERMPGLRSRIANALKSEFGGSRPS